MFTGRPALKARVVSLVTDPLALAVFLFLASASCNRLGSVTMLPHTSGPGESAVVEVSGGRIAAADTLWVRLDDRPVKVLERVDATRLRILVPAVTPGDHRIEVRTRERTVGTGALTTRAAISRRCTIRLRGDDVALARTDDSPELWSGHANPAWPRIAVDLVDHQSRVLFSTTARDPADGSVEVFRPAGEGPIASASRQTIRRASLLTVNVPNVEAATAIRVYRVPPHVDATRMENRKRMRLLAEFPMKDGR
jgi:hypothetical protein